VIDSWRFGQNQTTAQERREIKEARKRGLSEEYERRQERRR
jgi:hypothetical protein